MMISCAALIFRRARARAREKKIRIRLGCLVRLIASSRDNFLLVECCQRCDQIFALRDRTARRRDLTRLASKPEKCSSSKRSSRICDSQRYQFPGVFGIALGASPAPFRLSEGEAPKGCCSRHALSDGNFRWRQTPTRFLLSIKRHERLRGYASFLWSKTRFKSQQRGHLDA